MAAPVVHFEIHGTDLAKQSEFYSSLFGWELHNVMPEYTLIRAKDGEKGIDGGLGAGDRAPAKVIVYVEVDDPQAALDGAVALGGTVVSPVMSIPGQVTMAHFADPEGNVIGLVGLATPPK